MNIIQKIFGTHSQNELKRVYPIADAVMALDEDMQKLSDEELKAKTKEFKERLEKGEISQLFYDREIRRGRALTSYLGMNGIGLYEQNQQPMAIERGDVILLCSDGLMQALSTQTLEELLSQPGTAQQLTKKLQTVLLSHSDAMQDNTTLVLIKRHR